MLEIDSLFDEFKNKCATTVQACQKEMQGVNTGRANSSMLDKIMVEIYGGHQPLNSLATTSIMDSQTISVKVWDKTTVGAVEKAILSSNLDLNPIREGELLRIPITPMTQEKRQKLVKMIHTKAEEFKISIRNSRKIINEKLKKEQKTIPKDDYANHLKKIDEITKKYIDKVDEIIKKKEKSILN